VRFSYLLIIAVIFAVTCYSCLKKGGKYIDEGEIHYNIDYSGTIGSIPKEVMPKNLVVSFKDDKILFAMISPIGNSGILNLSNPKKDIYDTYFSILTLKYYYAAKQGEMYPGFEAMQGMELRKTDKTSVICGFNCKNAEITFPEDRGKIYNIWYTNEINVKNPNGSSPFHEIDGVMMGFFFLIGHAELSFTAETVYKKDIPDLTFERREKYQRVSREEIIKFINRMLTF
jgi:GLPGLI family protein